MRISLRKDKKSLIIAGIMLFFGLLVITAQYPEMLIMYVGFSLVSLLRLDLKPKFAFVYDFFLVLYASLFAIYFGHFITMYNHYFFLRFSVSSVFKYIYITGFYSFAVEFFIITILYLILNALMIPRKIAACISALPTLLLCVADYFVYYFRESELTPMDFSVINTAANVASGYSFPIIEPLIFIIVPILFFVVSVARIDAPKRSYVNKKNVLIHICIYAVTSLLFIGLFSLTLNGVYKNKTAKTFDDGGAYHNGYITNFALILMSLDIDEPINYDADIIQSIIDAECPTPNPDSSNIIVIMNEAYSDLSIYSNQFDSYDAPDIFWHELIQSSNTRSGYAYSSVFGGMTANSEYELLTGITTSRIPNGSIPYAMYIDSPMYSLASYLRDQGYNTTAIHPYLGNGYNRTSVYPNLGFDTLIFSDSCQYTEADTMRQLHFLSDCYAYDKVLSILDEDGNTKQFVFLVTIQNHGGYDDPEYTPEYRTYADGTDDAVNNYLSLIRQSDIALEHLITELSAKDEKYTILIFGDHQPALNLNPPLECGSDAWKIPYLIWTNYDMPEGLAGQNITTSINFLSLDVMAAAGISYSPYYEYIANIRQTIPAINSSGYYSKSEGKWIEPSAASSEELDALNLYYALQYYTLFDN